MQYHQTTQQGANWSNVTVTQRWYCIWSHLLNYYHNINLTRTIKESKQGSISHGHGPV